jgi:hypothetical protein
MALISIVLAALSLVSMALAVPTIPVPGVGAFFAFGAPALAFLGIVAGGVGISRGKRKRAPTGLALTGVIASALSLMPALFTAVTCGLLNVLFTAGPVQVQRAFQIHVQQGIAVVPADAGVAPPAAPSAAPGNTPPRPAGTPPPAFPPPPLVPKQAP